MAETETTSDPQAERHVFTADQLTNTDGVVDNIVYEYTKDLDTKSPQEIDQLVEWAVEQNIFQRTEGDEAKPDDNFGGAEVVPTSPAVRELLTNFRRARNEALTNEKVDVINNDLAAMPADAKAARLADLLEEALRRGEVSVHTVAEKRSGSGGKTYTENTPRIQATPGEGYATKLAIERVAATLGPESSKFKAAELDLARRAPQIKAEEAKRVDAFHNKLKQDERAEQARQKIAGDEAAERLKDAQERSEQERELGGIEYKTVRRRNPETGRMEKVQVFDRTNDAYVDAHTQALEDNRDFDRQRKYGTGEAAVKRAHEQALVENAQMDAAAKAAEDQRVADENQVGRDREHDYKHYRSVMPDRANYADQESYDADVKAAINADHDEALNGFYDRFGDLQEGDANARAQSEIYRRYQDRIDAAGKMIDPEVRKHMEAERDKAVGAERKRQIDLAKEQVDIDNQASTLAGDVRQRSARHESWHHTLTAADRLADKKVIANHKEMGLMPVPFLEARSGGVFHWNKDRRGPKVVESYFRIPGDENTVVVERRKLNGGDFISQTIVTTEQPISGSGPNMRPPREVFKMMDQIRASDRAQMISRSGNGLGGNSIGDYLATGNSSFDGPTSVYSQYPDYPDPNNSGTFAKSAFDRQTWYNKGRVAKSGGFFFWARRNR